MSRQIKPEIIRINVKSQLKNENRDDQVSYLTNSSNNHSSIIVPGSLDYHIHGGSPGEYEIIQYKFPHYFRFYFNLTFFLLLAPFRIKILEDGEVEVVTYQVHKIMCRIVQAIAGIMSILQLHRETTRSQINDDPEHVFAISNSLCWASYMIIFSRMVWSKSTRELFKFQLCHSTQKVQVVGSFLASIGFLFGTLCMPMQLLIDLDGSWNSQIENDSLHYMATENVTNKGLTNIMNEPNMRQFLAILLFIAEYLQELIIAHLEVFNLLVAIAVYEITSNMNSIFISREKLKTQVLLLHYADMWDHFTRINYINSGVLLVVYLQIISWVSSTALDFLQDHNWLSRIYMTSSCILYGSTFVLAAESNHKASLFEKRIWETQKEEYLSCGTTQETADYVSTFIKGTRGNATGLQGGRFFTVTYSFLGASLSVLLTFAMIIIQFRTDKD